MNIRSKAFVCYSRADAEHLKRMKTHLVPYIREKRVDVWEDTCITPGAQWKEEIKQAIALARVAILLVSADFMASEFIAQDELPLLLDTAEQQGMLVLPVILGPCAFEWSNLARYQSFNAPSSPLIKMLPWEQEAFWARLAKHVTDALTSGLLNGIPSYIDPPKSNGDSTNTEEKIEQPAIGTTLLTYKGHSGEVNTVAWSPDSERIASSSNDKSIQVWDATVGTTLLTYTGHSSWTRAAAWSPEDGKRIASASGGVFGGRDVVQVWNAVTGQHIFTCQGHSSPIWALAWSPDGKRIATGSRNKTIQINDTSTGSLLNTYKDLGSVCAVTWSPNSERIAAGIMGKKTIQIWDTLSDKLLLTCQGHFGDVNTVAWSPDGKYIASGSDDNTVQVWDALSGKSLLTCQGHSNHIRAVAWSPDGSRIASGSTDHTVQIWDALSGKPLFTYRIHSNYVETVAWSPDGKRIASGSSDNTVQVWSAG